VLYTIGHSNVALDAFLALLERHGVELLVDVRSQPYSRYTPHFSKDALARALPVRYLFLGDALGGRPASRALYDAAGNADYDEIERQRFYQDGIDRLLAEAARARTCFMCAEEDPLRCHRRRLVTRTLVHRGVRVEHIRGSGAVETEAQVAAREDPQLRLL
jgi:uncharacterized protein (DUF488 family)